MYRLSGNSGDEIIYFVPGKINSMQLYSFCSEDSNNLSFEISNDGYNFTKIEVTQNSYNNGKGDYGYWVPIAYSFNKASKSNYLKIKINNDTQLSRIELFYE
jgi:mannan endo-1,4-beta-mannosidase